MKESTTRFVPGSLMFMAGVFFMAGAMFVARPTTWPSYVFSALGIMFLCLGTLSLLRARRQK